MVSRLPKYYNSVKLADGLRCYIWQGRGNNCNSCLFTNVLRGERPHVLVDPGHVTNEFSEPCFDYLTKAMEGDGFKVEDIGLIINTHTHPDHCEANEKVVEKSGAWVTLSEEEDEFRNTLGKRLYSMFHVKIPEFTPLFYLKEGELNLGAANKVHLQIILSPGHSPGSVCLYWPEKKILITGDVVFYGSIGRTDFPSGSLSQLKQSIDRLSQLDVEYLVPGHSTELGSIVKGKKNVERNFQSVKLFI
ncbi:MAG: MBL fold metallo-hydrolase [Chloroflexi bacterium]|nr:MBL fold metallo-hydrolase [Chloroflexota bacterium]MBM3172919.1 MBL fold metallo-hydrolase [Chloroflexota bacterium]MBM3175249.1 MBL fold metallo-hydrolase [Chloroflexota bacterium]MBM4451209.1 MBL fold metallo-hydrolase [Chloroflexota bacterium]